MIEIKVEKFEGPLDLLLKLIEKEEMDITKVSLAYIADLYVEYIEKSDNIHPDDVSDFLLVASRLLLIKSRALLPYLYPEEEEIQEFTDQLKMYKEFLEASIKVEEILLNGKMMLAREFSKNTLMLNVNFFPPKELKAKEMSLVFSDLVKQLRPLEKFKEKTLELQMSLEERIIFIKKIILNEVRISFDKAIGDQKNKTDIVVSFLAMLELEKQKEIFIEQEMAFGEIIINKC
ncbi:segregation/condensation protein A [Candidatus Parcubacteria bacterium]|nr:segregation/condensation protein A [Candidatus Parcubacteria bacterium]